MEHKWAGAFDDDAPEPVQHQGHGAPDSTPHNWMNTPSDAGLPQRNSGTTPGNMEQAMRKFRVEAQRKSAAKSFRAQTDQEFLDEEFSEENFNLDAMELADGVYDDAMRGFGAGAVAGDIFNQIQGVRKLQEEIFRKHITVETRLEHFVKQGSNLKADASDETSRDFGRNFREEFDKKKIAMVDVSETLQQLHQAVDTLHRDIQQQIPLTKKSSRPRRAR